LGCRSPGDLRACWAASFVPSPDRDEAGASCWKFPPAHDEGIFTSTSSEAQ
jgi:hypothetical protein